MGTLEQTLEEIKQKLEDPNKSTIVLVGDSGMGKTWMARKISEDDKYYDTLWVYMTEKYDINLFYEDIEKQYLSLGPITEEWKHDEDETPLFVIKVEPEEKKADQKEESLSTMIRNKMREIGHALSKENILLLVLDDVGNNNDLSLYVTLSTEWRSMFLPKLHNHLKIIITTRELRDRNGQQTIEVIDFPKHLQPQESSDLLRASVGINVYEKSNCQQLREAIADGKSEGIRTPATITVIGKALNYIAQHDPSELDRAILQAAYYEKTSDEREKLNPLIYCACDMIKSSVTKNCFWHSMHLFHSYGGIHFNVLITHWIMEGYFDRFDHIEEAYREAHDVLMELIKRALLKIQENNVVVVEGAALNMIDSCLLGFSCTAALRLFSVFKDESLGRVTRMDGMIKTLCNPKSWRENSTLLLIDDTHLSQEVHQAFFNSMKELKVLAVFKAKCKSPLISSLSEMDKLLVLVLRGCDLLDGIIHINKLKTLKVLEISSRDNHSISLPDELFDGMTDLQSLNLSGLQMKSLSSIHNLRELRSLILRQSSDQSSQLEEVESLKELVKLEILDLSGASSLKSMPSNLFDEITNLQSLNLSGLKLIKSFPSFSKLSELRVLMLRRCSRLQFLESLRGLDKLQILDISDSTSFEKFDDLTLSVLPKIQMINLSRTKIQSLPEFNIELRDLTQIFLSGCPNLHNLPTLQLLVSLQILDLSGATMFETFTDQSIQDLDQLRILDVSKTSISKLPSIPSNLLELNLRGCYELKELPSTIYQENLKEVPENTTCSPG